MTTDQAIARIERKAKDLRDKGFHQAAHDWQRDASDLKRLVRVAEHLPAVRRTATPPRAR